MKLSHSGARRQVGQRTLGIRLVLALGLLALVLPRADLAVAGAEDDERATQEAGLPELPQPRPLDPALPIQEMFRDWPPQDLLERPYWVPWSASSFQKASLFGRPVLFVMAVTWNRRSQRMLEETLSDPRILTVVNESYVSVLVNPDRRPDLHARYQTGTWPVIAFLMPNGLPMVSQANEQGVARPITTGWIGVERMLFLLREGDKYYDRWSGLLGTLGRTWADREETDEPVAGQVNAAASDGLTRWLLGSADKSAGGFGLAPKFVIPGLYEYAALRQARLVPALESHARLTLDKLVKSPLFDSKDGGVHRLAVSPRWEDIQYEKMLHVNTALMRELVFALREKEDRDLRRALERTAAFVLGRLGREAGGFHLAQIADPRSPDGGGYWVGDHDQAPPVDPLVLAGPNALAGAALIRAGILLGDETMIGAGRSALDLVYERAYKRGRGVDHVVLPGPESLRFLWSQAEVAFGFLDAYETTGDSRLFEAARDLVDFCTLNLSALDSPLLRDHLPKPPPIGLLPNPRYPMRPNVLLARVMLRLWHHGAGEDYFGRGMEILGAFSGDLAGYRAHGPWPALAVEEAIQAPVQVEIHGEPTSPETLALRRAAVNARAPWVVIVNGAPDAEPRAVLRRDEQTFEARRPDDVEEQIGKLSGLARGRNE